MPNIAAQDKTLELCNRFVLVPKANGKVQFSLDPTRLKVLIIPVHMRPYIKYPANAGRCLIPHTNQC